MESHGQEEIPLLLGSVRLVNHTARQLIPYNYLIFTNMFTPEMLKYENSLACLDL
jgi:hypothetical protein